MTEHHDNSKEQENFQQSRQSRSTSDFNEASEQVKQSQSLIIKIWEERVRNQVRAAEGRSSLSLVNTLSVFLKELVILIKLAEASHGHVSPEKEMSRVHGGERATFIGYFLPQLLKEFSILREVIVELLLDKNVLTHRVRSVIDKAIDSVISLAATEFVKVQQGQTRAALYRAEMSNKDLEHFAAVAAHDLKSPLATISGYLSLISEESEGPFAKAASEYIDFAQKAAERMRNLIDRLLEYSRMTRVDRPFQMIDMENIINSATQNLSDSIEKANAIITTPEPLPRIMGDAILLTQLFQNLISNSIKFRGKSRPEIVIKAEDRKEMWLISLKDNGLGFDPKDKENIFTLYKKLHGESEYSGSGIGLATCRKVVELHGGMIWADSTPGHGTVFYFTLPKIGQDQADYH